MGQSDPFCEPVSRSVSSCSATDIIDIESSRPHAQRQELNAPAMYMEEIVKPSPSSKVC